VTSLGVQVKVRPGFSGIGGRWTRRIVEGTLLFERKKAGFLSVLVTNDREIRKLNKRFLGHDFATDVISFSAKPGKSNPVELDYLGDVAVSYETAKAFSRKLKVPYREELARYLVHGTLHLLGYDDKKAGDKKVMHERQEKILKRVLKKK
jgi:probable rRNA maturation factor